MPAGFQFVFNDYGSNTHHITSIMATNAEAFTKGEAVKLAAGRWTKATNGAAIAGFAMQNLAAGTNQFLDVQLAREGDWFEAPYTGTPDAAFIVGCEVADVAADGLSVLASDVTGGMFSVLEINTNKATCKVKVKKRVFS
ncbi:hypothetical protein NYE44_01680 [Paenibacillus sp. FSL L8-0493]|uniref:Phage tail protein n=1 Tax=Paenibacillus odorifer TaxID=189426 RepID=A0ABX3GUD0_9BACL|nr:hypothetical protein [Paenibacillus odorifer]OMC79591.1 hypothetical protein BK125_04745 [Paenibacillus odorifer]OMD19209.1 hypothetical protein BJP48_11925 [Paenibacillus odorifer]OMD34937.1 hypothetical protein BSO21_09990 [Paenibacillus odorifer]OMD92718.1 hypothetical protein BSK67_18315 [Paenibacillus odorifer]